MCSPGQRPSHATKPEKKKTNELSQWGFVSWLILLLQPNTGSIIKKGWNGAKKNQIILVLVACALGFQVSSLETTSRDYTKWRHHTSSVAELSYSTASQELSAFCWSSSWTSQQHWGWVLDVALERFQKFRTDCTYFPPTAKKKCHFPNHTTVHGQMDTHQNLPSITLWSQLSVADMNEPNSYWPSAEPGITLFSAAPENEKVISNERTSGTTSRACSNLSFKATDTVHKQNTWRLNSMLQILLAELDFLIISSSAPRLYMVS